MPKIHEVYIVKAGRLDLLVNRLEKSRCRFIDVESFIKILLNGFVGLASLLWPKPSSYLCYLFDLFAAITCGSNRLVNLLVLLLEG